jgi:hypothetical protein
VPAGSLRFASGVLREGRLGLRYLAFGQVRTEVGTKPQTDYGFTGQRNNSYIKLMDYKARLYDRITEFRQPDALKAKPYRQISPWLNQFIGRLSYDD